MEGGWEVGLLMKKTIFKETAAGRCLSPKTLEEEGTHMLRERERL